METMTDHHQSYPQHLVLPGQVIASTTVGSGASTEDSFLRGHGTYLEEQPIDETDPAAAPSRQLLLRASVTGTVQRVNKLISVQSLSSQHYDAHVGDLVVGRVVAVQGQKTGAASSRWKVELMPGRTAVLPLSGVHLRGGVQRIRTQQDAADMRQYLREGDIVAAQIHKIQAGGTWMLHTRSSIKHGKLENGCFVTVPPSLMTQRHALEASTCCRGQFLVIWGFNGGVWMQRALQEDETEEAADGPELVERQEKRRHQHAATPYSLVERQNLARLRNAVVALKRVQIPLTVAAVERVYENSLALSHPADMLRPEQVVQLTESCRVSQQTK